MNALEVDAGGVRMKNPVALASGTCGYGEVYADSYDPSLLGAVVVKGISLEARPGNPAPRMAETPSGMLNAIGLENVGLTAFLAEKLPWLVERKVTVVVNVFGETMDEYERLCAELSDVKGVAGLELNISCPNVKAGGMAFGASAQAAAELTARARKATRLPLWVKLTPNVGDVAEVARAVEGAGADAVSLINTVKGMAIDVERRRPVLASVTGGLSGPAIRPIALRMVYETARAVKVPVVGLGGIMNSDDAIAFLLAGATAVQIGTANFVDPGIPPRVISGIEQYLKRHGLKSVQELIGGLKA
ncbi:MAG TPA: dihydroorotate dehydrogenase [bacterium]|nr:dihydroorotate dehydrogenase [bacterium]